MVLWEEAIEIADSDDEAEDTLVDLGVLFEVQII